MYQSLYREYRPLTFDEVLGQDSITKILKNQIINNKLSHAYLFSGPRGTGKTSSAKIFSRAVNCLHPEEGNPCNRCENCKALLEGRTMDVVEMDAASNRKIDDIRELREKVIYPPTGLHYKVYIIDEAHMITMEGFNALLKIMEEPPAHLIFILATTELEKIPGTILSRTQRFEFKKIEDEDIEYNLNRVAKEIGLQLEEEACSLIARKAEGAMRDALSILDQVASLEKTYITPEDVHFIAGTVEEDAILSLTRDIVEMRSDKALINLHRIVQGGKDVSGVVKGMIQIYRQLLMVKSGGYSLLAEDIRKEHIQSLQTLCDSMELPRIYEGLEILLDYEIKMRMSDNERALCEVMLLRLIDYVDRESLASRIRRLEKTVQSMGEGDRISFSGRQKEKKDSFDEETKVTTADSFLSPESFSPEPEETDHREKEQEISFEGSSPAATEESVGEEWDLLLEELAEESPLFLSFLKGAKKVLKKEENFYVVIDEKETFSMQRFNRPEYVEKVSKTVEKIMGSSTRVSFVYEKELSEAHSGTQKVLDFFGKENTEIIR